MSYGTVEGEKFTATARVYLTPKGELTDDLSEGSGTLVCTEGSTMPLAKAEALGLYQKPARKQAKKPANKSAKKTSSTKEK